MKTQVSCKWLPFWVGGKSKCSYINTRENPHVWASWAKTHYLQFKKLPERKSHSFSISLPLTEKCDKGYYQNQEDKGCLPCPIGTFQESLGATSCEPCGVNRTTSQDGTDSRALCIPGKVNECQLKIDSCDLGAECVDQDDGFTCECKHGKTLTGQCVPGEFRVSYDQGFCLVHVFVCQDMVREDLIFQIFYKIILHDLLSVHMSRHDTWIFQVSNALCDHLSKLVNAS